MLPVDIDISNPEEQSKADTQRERERGRERGMKEAGLQTPSAILEATNVCN